MAVQNIPVVDLREWEAGGRARERFVRDVGESLAAIGFFAVQDHGVPDELTKRAYDAAHAFFHLPPEVKARYHDPARKGQRGFTGFGKEHAKDSLAPDLKEFWQVGRPGYVHPLYGANLWPDEVPDFAPTLVELYQRLDRLGGVLLEACAAYIDEPPERFREMTTDSDTIVRVL